SWEMIALCHSRKKATFNNPFGKYDEIWFIRRIKRLFHTLAAKDDVSYEAYLFYHNDIDNSLIPAEHLSKLPNPLLLQTYQHIDSYGNDLIAGIVIEEDTRELLYEIWLKNGKAIAYEMYVD